MTLSDIVNAIRAFPGITRKHTIHEIVHFLPTASFANVAASEGEDAAAIEFGNDYILFAADGIMAKASSDLEISFKTSNHI